MTQTTSVASARWTGGAKEGGGTLSTESGALRLHPFSSGAPPRAAGSTHPAELIAAAQASSFSATLVHKLELAGFTPDHIVTVATVTEELAASGWVVAKLSLDVHAKVPRALQGDFIDAALRAKADFPASRMLDGNIFMKAKLEM